MPAIAAALDQLSFSITDEILIRSSTTATFAAVLEELGPANRNHTGAPMPMVLEAWPGGRWYRDLGDNNGHFWAHVQAIKQPTLLELSGPLMMSFAAWSNIQYRLKEVDGGTLLTLSHSALGLFPDGYRENMSTGIREIVDRVKRRAEVA